MTNRPEARRASDMAPPEVGVFDHIVLPAHDTDGWLESWSRQYRPGAHQRGMSLAGLWQGFDADPGRRYIVIHWTAPSLDDLWWARWKSRADRTVTEFWQSTDERAITRDRRVLQAIPQHNSGGEP
jgi:hypothetical protein